MQTIFKVFLAVLISFSLHSCEDKIDVNLNDADPRLVIEADLTNLSRNQEIKISRTVAFDENRAFEPVDQAEVIVRSSTGRVYTFESIGNGKYRHANMMVNAMQEYTLLVRLDGKEYTATSRAPRFVEIDSLGITKETILNDDYYFINLSFDDPGGEDNYYKYSISTNGEPFKFNTVFSDKFNDGLHVKHQLGGRNIEFENGDSINLRRYSLAKDVYTYWSEYQSTNPGSASPANPKSNISNGALGYFAVSTVKEYKITIQDEDGLSQ